MAKQCHIRFDNDDMSDVIQTHTKPTIDSIELNGTCIFHFIFVSID